MNKIFFLCIISFIFGCTPKIANERIPIVASFVDASECSHDKLKLNIATGDYEEDKEYEKYRLG